MRTWVAGIRQVLTDNKESKGNEDQGSQWNPEEISIDCNVLCIV